MDTHPPSQSWRISLIACLLFVLAVSSVRAQDTTVRRELAAMRADMGVLNENMRKLNAAQSALKEKNGSLRDTLETVHKRLGALADENQSLQEDLRELRAQLKKERSARRELGEDLVDTVTAQVERILTRHAERTAIPRRRDSAPPEADGDIPIQGRYTVVRGDTLSAIAGAFDISVKRLKQANNLTTDLIREGQVLNIPEPQ